jgi:hypothetical protein
VSVKLDFRSTHLTDHDNLVCVCVFAGEDVTDLFVNIARSPEGCDNTEPEFHYSVNITYVPPVSSAIYNVNTRYVLK